MSSAMGMMGQEKFNVAKSHPAMVKVTVTYIATIAKAIGDITGDPQLQAIGVQLAQRLPPAKV